MEDIQQGFWAPSDKQGTDGFYWQREVSTWDFPRLVSKSASRYSLKDLWDYWCSLPKVTKPKVGSSKKGKERNQKDRLQSYLQSAQVTKDVLREMDLPFPPVISDIRAMIRQVGKLIASKTFLTRTPQVVMELPIATGCDASSPAGKSGLRREDHSDQGHVQNHS